MRQVATDLKHRVSQAKTRLIAKCPFFGYLTLRLRLVESEDWMSVPTMAIAPDGTLVLDRTYAATLSDPELAGLLAHAVMHCAFFYWARKGSRIDRLFNIAHDLSFNGWIEEVSKKTKGAIKLAPGSLRQPKFDGEAAETIYEKLFGNPQEIPLVGGGAVSSESSGGSMGGDCRADLALTQEGKSAAAGSETARRKLETEWKIEVSAALQRHESQARSQGDLPLGMRRAIEELLDPSLAWEDQIYRWTGEHGNKTDYTFRKPGRRSQALGQYMPSQAKFGTVQLVLMVDTSGSVWQHRLRRVIGEIGGICEEIGSEVRVQVIDAALHDDLVIEDAIELLDKLSGGGGSDLRPGFKILEETGFQGAVIAFTDGMISVPDNKPPSLEGVLWVLYEGEKAPANWGEVVYMPRDDSI